MLNLKNTLDGYLKNIEVIGNTIQDANNLANIRSVGDKVEGQELYKIDIVSTNNIIDVKSITSDSEAIRYSIEPIRQSFEVMKLKGYNVSILIHKNNSWQRNVVLKTNGLTTINLNDGEYVKEILLYVHDGWDLSKQYNLTNIIHANIKLEHQQLTILSPVQLEKVGDVADRIICKDGVWGVEKNIATIILNESNNWVLSTNEGDNTIRFKCTINSSISNKKDCLPILSNKFKSNITTSSDIEGIQLWGETKELQVRINKSKLNTPDVQGFKNWIKDNNIKVKHRITQHQFIPLPHDQQVKLRTFAGQTNIAFLTEIPGQIKAQVPKSLGATVNTHTEQIAELHNSLDRVKKLEETTVSTVETESNFTTVDATSNGYFEDVKLEGKTLVNLCPTINKQYNNIDRAVSNSITIIGKVPSDNTHKITLQYLRRSDGTTIWTDLTTDGNGFFSKIEDIATIHQIYFNGSNPSDYSKYKFLILEGDYTNNPPEYFEGLTSVGQYSDEIEILSSNINLWDGVFYENTSISIDGVPINTKGFVSTDYIEIDAKRDIFVNVIGATNNDVHAFYYRNDKTHIIRQLNVNKSDKLDVPTDAHYIRLQFYVAESQTLDNIKSTVVSCDKRETVHTKGLVNKKPLLYYNPTTETWEKPVLREWDTIEKHSDGKYYYHKRSGEGVFDGLEADIRVNADLDTVTRFFVAKRLPNCKGQINGKQIFDRYKFDANFTGAYVHAYIDTDGNAMIFSECKTVEAFKSELQANNVTVVYQLAQEEVYECTNIDLMTYSGETNYIINSGAISPKSLLKVHNNISNVVKILQEKVSLLENTFIAGLKSVLSGDMYSLATILYPEDFEQNDNTEQDIMVIPE